MERYYLICSITGMVTFILGNFMDSQDYPIITIIIKSIAGWCIGSVLGAVMWGYLTTV